MKATFTETKATIDYRYFGTDVLTDEEITTPDEEVITIDMPELTGSEKQIAWAMDIREREIMTAVNFFNEHTDAIMKEMGATTKTDVFQFIFYNNDSKFSWVTKETSAKNIIENYR